MAVMNPCCCKLQLGVTIVAIVNMGISCAALLWYLVTLLIGSVALAAVAQKNQEERFKVQEGQIVEVPARKDSETYTAVAVLGMFLLIITIIFVISSLITFITSFILFIGARKKEVGKCRLWFAVTLVFLVIYIFFKIFNIGVALWAWEANGRVNTPVLTVAVVKEVVWAAFSLAIEGYQLWVVYAFIDELKREQANPSYVPCSTGVVHYVPKPEDEPPPYGPNAGYTPYSGTPYSGTQMYPQYGPMPSSNMGPSMLPNLQYK